MGVGAAPGFGPGCEFLSQPLLSNRRSRQLRELRSCELVVAMDMGRLWKSEATEDVSKSFLNSLWLNPTNRKVISGLGTPS